MDSKIEHIIAKLLEGKLSYDDRKLLTEWCEIDDSNRKLLADLININQLTNPAFKLSEEDVLNAETKLHRKISTTILTNRFIAIWKSIAAVLLIPLILSLFVLNSRNDEIKSTAQNTYQEIYVQPGSRLIVTLPDNSKIWLNAGSKLKYPLAFTSDERRVYLDGEAFFEVNSNPDYPFIVNATNMEVMATGTSFNVETYTNENTVAVTLVEGKVTLNLNTVEQEKIQIQPNQRFVLDKTKNKFRIDTIEAENLQKWKDGILIFRDERLENVFSRLGRTFNVNIVINDSVLKDQLYRATFQDESLERILQLIEKTAPISYVREEKSFKNNHFQIQTIEVNRKQN